MATGGVTDLNKGTDEIFDFLCSICKGKKKLTEAETFCSDCHDYYCATCVKFHDDVPALRTHKILDKKQFLESAGSSDKFPAVPTERCKEHAHKPVDMYCRQHDQVGCSTCMAVQHSACQHKFYVPKFINTNTISSNTQDIETKLDSLAKSLNELQENFDKEKENLKSRKGNLLEEIRKFRTEINTKLDKLETYAIQELEQNFQSLIEKIEAEQNNLLDALTRVKSAQDSLKSAGGNMSQTFVSIKMADLIASHAQVKVNTTTSQVSSPVMCFVADQKLQSLLQEVQSLGSIKVTGSLQSQPQGSDTLGMLQAVNSQAQPQGFDTQSKLQAATAQTCNKSCNSQPGTPLLQIKGSKKYNVNVKSDKNRCNLKIFGICTLDDGTIILTDNSNSKLKRLDSVSYTVSDCCDLPAWPCQVCSINNHEAAVSCSKSQLIQFVSIGSTMQTIRQIKTGFRCYGLAYVDEKLYVSDWETSVYVYTVSGARLQQFVNDQSGQVLFKQTRSIVLSNDKSVMYVTDIDKGLIILNRNGSLVGQFNGPEIKGSFGVCLYNDSVLVCGHHSKNILQFTPDGKLIGEVLKDSSNILSLCCHKNNSKLIVGFLDRDEIEIYDIRMS